MTSFPFNADMLDQTAKLLYDHIPEFYNNKDGAFWVAVDKDKVVASIGVHKVDFREESAGFIRRLAVTKTHRRQKLGEKLHQEVLNWANKQKWRYLVLGVDNPSYNAALTFYPKMGYSTMTIDEAPYDLANDNDEFYFYKDLKTNV